MFSFDFFTLDKVLNDTLTTLLDLLDEYINGQKLTDKKTVQHIVTFPFKVGGNKNKRNSFEFGVSPFNKCYVSLKRYNIRMVC